MSPLSSKRIITVVRTANGAYVDGVLNEELPSNTLFMNYRVFRKFRNDTMFSKLIVYSKVTKYYGVFILGLDNFGCLSPIFMIS